MIIDNRHDLNGVLTV